LGFFAGYTLTSSGVVLFTSDPIPPGSNVFTSIALSRLNINEQGGHGVAGIWKWESYGAGGQPVTHNVGSAAWTTQNSAFINNCRSVTYALAVDGFATAQISLATF
jgi:hypothetical protein